MDIQNIHCLPPESMERDAVGLTTQMLNAAGANKKFYVNIDSVPPQAYSTKYHSHSQQEEFFLVLSGNGTLRVSGQEHPVRPGDFFAKPAGQGIAHTFFNAGPEALVILDIGTNEPEDTCYYPDEDVYLQKSHGQTRVFHGQDLDKTWVSDTSP